jgi:hypothetical protein
VKRVSKSDSNSDIKVNRHKQHKGTKSPTDEEAMQYMTKTISRTFPEKNLLLTTANEIKT